MHNNGAIMNEQEIIEQFKNGNEKAFDVLVELLLVKEMTQEIFDKVEGYLTVYGDGKVNLNTADVLVLKSLGMRDSLAEKVITFREGDDGRIGTEDDNAFDSVENAGQLLSGKAGLSVEESDEFNVITGSGLAGVQSNNFRGVSVGALQEQAMSAQIVFIIDRDEQIHYWKEN